MGVMLVPMIVTDSVQITPEILSGEMCVVRRLTLKLRSTPPSNYLLAQLFTLARLVLKEAPGLVARVNC